MNLQISLKEKCPWTGEYCFWLSREDYCALDKGSPKDKFLAQHSCKLPNEVIEALVKEGTLKL